MARVQIYGREDPELSDEKAEEVQEKWVNDDYEESEKVYLGPREESFEYDDIKGFYDWKDKEAEQKRQEKRQEMKKEMNEVRAEWDEFRSFEPEKKAKIWYKNVFMTLYLTRKGFGQILGSDFEDKLASQWYDLFKKDMGAEVRMKLWNTIIEWYNNNPGRIFPDREVYDQFLPDRSNKKFTEEVDGMKQAGDVTSEELSQSL